MIRGTPTDLTSAPARLRAWLTRSFLQAVVFFWVSVLVVHYGDQWVRQRFSVRVHPRSIERQLLRKKKPR